MQHLNVSELKTYEQLSGLTQKELFHVVLRYLQKTYKTVAYTDKYICAEGDIPIALVAHLDTVYAKTVKELYYDQEKNVMWSPQGLGADDRAGVFLILKIIKSGLRPHIIFTTDEETGGKGATALVQSNFRFKELKYLIELDRANSNDCVFYNVYNPEFFQYIESFGFVQDYGTFTDICIICSAWKTVGVNLSVGYYDEHSYSERLHVGQMLSTYYKVCHMLKVASIPDFIYKEASSYGREYSLPKGMHKCFCCDEIYSEYELFPAKDDDGTKKYVCAYCIEDGLVDWCDECGEAYLNWEQSNDHICPDCKLTYTAKESLDNGD